MADGRVIDPWVNVKMGEQEPPEWLIRAKEARELDLRPGVLDKFLYANGERLFFRPRSPRYEAPGSG